MEVCGGRCNPSRSASKPFTIQFYIVVTAQITSRWENGVAVSFLQPVLPIVETCFAHALLAGTDDWLNRIAILPLALVIAMVC